MSEQPLTPINVPDGNSRFPGLEAWFKSLAASINVQAIEVLNRAFIAAGMEAKRAIDEDPRIPLEGDDGVFRLQNKDGGIPFRVEEDSTWVGTTEMRPTDDDHFRLATISGHMLLDADPVSGEVYIPLLRTSGGGGTGGGALVRRVILDVWAGQSNAEGRGRPFGPELDPQDERIRMWDWSTNALTTATVPLSSQQSKLGLSPATVVARDTIRDEPEGSVIVILNAAAGGSGLIADVPQGNWSVGYVGANPRLYPIMLTALDRAVAAIRARYGMAPTVRFFWHQGEADYESNPSAYATALDQLVEGVRAHLGQPDLPVILGGVTALNNPITAVHKQTPLRLVRTGYAESVPNGGGSSGPSDAVHYHREGVEKLGAGMAAAYRRALTNTTDSVPVPPLTVASSLTGGTLTVSWSAPLCRVTGYLVEYSANNAAWATVPARAVPLDRQAIVGGLTGTVRVRVSTINDVGTSNPTQPVTA